MEFFAVANGIPVHISDTQRGDVCVFFLHGYLQTLYVWEEFQGLISKRFVELGLGVPRFVSIDLPGHGLTGTHPVCNSMEFCADVVRGVLDVCKVSSCVVIGHSLGGFIAQMCLKRYPERFSYAFLLNTLTCGDSLQVRAKREREIAFIAKGRFMELVSLVVPNMFFKGNLCRVQNHVQEILENCETHDINGIVASIRGMMERGDMTGDMQASVVPYVFFVSTDDFYINYASYLSMIDVLKKPEESYRFQVVDACGHSAFLENPCPISCFISDMIVRCVCKLDLDDLEGRFSTKGSC